MNIQIFGTKKDFDCKKAERYFKERNISFQFIDMKDKGMSRGEFDSVCRAVGGDAVMGFCISLKLNRKEADLNLTAEERQRILNCSHRRAARIPCPRRL